MSFSFFLFFHIYTTYLHTHTHTPCTHDLDDLLKLKSKWGGKVFEIILNVAQLLLADGLVWVSQKLLIYWDFPSQPSLRFTEKHLKKKEYPVSSGSLGVNTMLMSEEKNPAALNS